MANTTAYNKAYYLKNKEKIIEYVLSWKKRNQDKVRTINKRYLHNHSEAQNERMKLYQKTENGKRLNSKAFAKYYSTEIGKKKHCARRSVAYALVTGKLIKSNECAHCNRRIKLSAHHHLGYEPEHWLDVIWLCYKCHKQVDKLLVFN